METKVVNLYKDKYDVYIGRAGKGQSGYFGNPFPLKNETERQHVLDQYREYFYKRIESDEEFRSRVLELKGKTLGCFCEPKMCHGHIIKEYLDNLDCKNNQNGVQEHT